MKTISFTIIEDNDTARLVLKHLLLKCFHCKVSEAENGKIGLEVILKTRPDILILDLSMPEIDGVSLLSKIRNIDQLKDLPVIITSAVNNEELIKKTVALGIESYLLKPLDSKTVLQRIGELVEKLGGKKKIDYLINEN